MKPRSITYPLHVYDLHRSAKVGTREAKTLLAKGWRIKRLEDHSAYCSAGAVGLYHYCLHDGEQELRQITDKALEASSFDLASSETLTLDHSMVILHVPFGERSLVKDLRGCWLDMFKHWACLPSETEVFSRWLTDTRIIVNSEADRLRLNVPRDEVEQAKSHGAFWALTESGSGAWFCFTAEAAAFSKWITDAE